MAGVPNLRERLLAQQEAFAKAPVGGGAFVKEWPEDGTYQGLVRSFDHFETKVGDACIKTELEVAFDPKYKGWCVEAIHNLENEERHHKTKEHFSKILGRTDFEIVDLLDGSDLLAEMLDVPIEFAIKTSENINEKTGQPYRNVYVNQRLGDKLGAPTSDLPADTADLDDPPPELGGEDEDIPF